MAKTITIDVKTAERLLELYRNCEAADSAFKTCQSVQFRNHIQSVYKAQNIESAFETLNQKLVAASESETAAAAAKTDKPV